MFQLDALTLLLGGAGGRLLSLVCSVGFGLLAGQLGGFGISPCLLLTLAGGLGLALGLLFAVLGGFALQALAFLFLKTSLLRCLLGYLALAVDSFLLGLLLAELLQLGLLGFVLLAGHQRLSETLGREFLGDSRLGQQLLPGVVQRGLLDLLQHGLQIGGGELVSA
ncbi:hypothetical protein D3C80_1198010 [compost metagenome]